MRLGFDVDGVFADFNEKFIPYSIAVTGKDLYPARPFDITTWNYPESYGYTLAEVSAVWKVIKADPSFWLSTNPYADAYADLYRIKLLQNAGHEIYFITARPGIEVKRQTEQWLEDKGFPKPTVLISSHKGLCARTLSLDAYIDDKKENVIDVLTLNFGNTRTFLLDRPWNQGLEEYLGKSGIYGKTTTRVFSVQQMLSLLA